MWEVFAGFYPSFCVEGLTEANAIEKVWDMVAFYEGGVKFNELANGPVSVLCSALENATRLSQERKKQMPRS